MSTTKTVPAVTYTLLATFEEKRKLHELEETYRKEEEAREKERADYALRALTKIQIREEIRETHVVPSYFLEAKRSEKEIKEKLRIAAEDEQHKNERRARELLAENKKQAERRKEFKRKIAREKVIPINVKSFPELFEKNEVGKSEVIECEDLMISVVYEFAKAAGFDVEVDEEQDTSALILWKPIPYHLFAPF